MRALIEGISADRHLEPGSGLLEPVQRLTEFTQLEEELGVGVDRGHGFLDCPLQPVLAVGDLEVVYCLGITQSSQ